MYYYPQQKQQTNQNPIAMNTYMPTQFLKGRPVASLDEVRGTPIDFDGSVFFFPDLANKKIYTKQINMDGTASLQMYELSELPAATVQQSTYITREEFETAINELRQASLQAAPQPEKKPVKQDTAFNF